MLDSVSQCLLNQLMVTILKCAVAEAVVTCNLGIIAHGYVAGQKKKEGCESSI